MTDRLYDIFGFIDAKVLRKIVREETKAAIAEDREEQAAIAWKLANEESIRMSERIREAIEDMERQGGDIGYE